LHVNLLKMSTTQTHFRTCNLCEAMCGLEIKHTKTEIISIKGDNSDVLSHGHICPKALALEDVYFDKDRIKTPLKRIENGWEEISWKQAFNEVENALKNIQNKYGNNAVATYRGNPNVHNLGMMLYGSPFLKSLNTQQKYSATSVDQLPHHIVSLLMFGHQMMIPIPDIDHTDFMLIIGGNPAVSNGSMMSAPNFSGRLKKIKKKGGKFIVIDPRFTETAKIANQHFFIKPGKDVLFLLALVHVILNEDLSRKNKLATHCVNWNGIENLVSDFSPENVSSIIGISYDDIKLIARDFANAKTAVCYGRLGVSTQEFGGTCLWLINILNIITDNFDKKGGALFTLPAIDLVGMAALTGKTGSFDRRRSRVENLPEFSGEYPVATLSEEILTKGEGQIKAMVTIGGNPVLSTPNGKKLAEALDELEFMVAIDIYINETTKHANIILPSTTGLETSHYDLAFHQLTIRNTANYSSALFSKTENQKHDWEILNELTQRFTGKENKLTPEIQLDFMLKNGPYKDQNISLKTLIENPHGIDFGPLKPSVPERLFTSNKKIELIPEALLKDLNRLKTKLEIWKKEEVSEFPFYLIGRRHLRSNNSWMHNSKILMTGRERCTLFINTIDAEKLNIKNKQLVEVVSNTGKVKLPAEITDEMMVGVVSIPHGFGHTVKGIKLELAQKNAGVSINDLTDAKKIDALTGNADFSGTKVGINIV